MNNLLTSELTDVTVLLDLPIPDALTILDDALVHGFSIYVENHRIFAEQIVD